MDKKQLKKDCIKLYRDGKNLSEIAEITGWSRKYITDLLKEDTDFLNIRNSRKIKVYKRLTNNQMSIAIPTEFIKKIGISRDREKADYVNIIYNEKDKTIIIKKA